MQSLILLLPDELSVVPPFLQQTWTNALLSSIHGGLSQCNIKAQHTEDLKVRTKIINFENQISFIRLGPTSNHAIIKVLCLWAKTRDWYCRGSVGHNTIADALWCHNYAKCPNRSNPIVPGFEPTRCPRFKVLWPTLSCGQRCVPWCVSKQFWVTQLTKPGLFINFHFTHFSIHHKT